MFESILDLVFPPRCAACRRIEESTPPLCSSCAADIKLRSTLACGECRARLPENKRICHRDVPYLLGAAADYDSHPVRSLIHALKFMHVPTAAAPLAGMLVRYYRGLGIDFPIDHVLPVPLSSGRERARGYNQAALIGEEFAKALSLPWSRSLLIRTRETKPQTELSFDARQKNLIGSFRAPGSLRGKSLILIDDVTTSGATFRAAAEALKSSGARRIIALAVAEA